mgnify:CR=1 FL=1
MQCNIYQAAAFRRKTKQPDPAIGCRGGNIQFAGLTPLNEQGIIACIIGQLVCTGCICDQTIICNASAAKTIQGFKNKWESSKKVEAAAIWYIQTSVRMEPCMSSGMLWSLGPETDNYSVQ